MTARNEVDARIAEWVSDLPSRAPDGILEPVLAELHVTPQQGRLRATVRRTFVQTTFRGRSGSLSAPMAALAALAIVVLVGGLFLSRLSDPGIGTQPTPSPTATATPTDARSPSPSLAIALEEASASTFTFLAPREWQVLQSTKAVDSATWVAASALRSTAELNPGGTDDELASSVEEIEPLPDAAVAISSNLGSADGGLVIGIFFSPFHTVARAPSEIQASLESSNPEEVVYVETTTVPAGEAVHGAARFERGGVLYRANIFIGDSRRFVVTFATRWPYEQSRPVFDAILNSIAKSE